MPHPKKSMAGTPTPAAELAEAQALLEEAHTLAWEWHGRQTRKGRVTSYMSHLLQVQGRVIDAGGGAEETIAALLHDALEDAPDAAERAFREEHLEARFGPAVLRIILDCTDTTREEFGDQKGPWRIRKERYIQQLSQAEPASRRVAACDKLHNLGDLVNDLRCEGPATLDRFNAGPTEQIWYFEALAEILRPEIPSKLAQELDDLVAELKALILEDRGP